jgi:hypothetical protein
MSERSRNDQPRILISYRREDSAGHVLAMVPALRQHFGADRIVKDTDNITSDADLISFVSRGTGSRSVLLAIIGPDWLSVQDPANHRRRLDDPKDFLRREIAAALATPYIQVIPVLIGGATMPLGELPGELSELSFKRAVTLSDSRWDSDLQGLIKVIEAAFSQPPTSKTNSANRTLFLCYRREDTQDAAGRLHDRLVDAYGPDHVFMDIDSVPLGIDFVDHVTDQISRCSGVIVMIGRQWLTATDVRGRRRLDFEDDLVRTELAAALERKIPVIPVLVQDATVPASEDLPPNIKPLARRNGINLTGAAWKAGVERLIKELDHVMKA